MLLLTPALSVLFWFPRDPLVMLPQGLVIGRWDRSERGQLFQSFQGIPYGAVETRFSRAVPAGRFPDGLLEAKEEGDVCPQLDRKDGRTIGKEDCLNVNVYVPPEGGRDLPVMVWIHGGAFIKGSGKKYRPDYLMDYGVIVVTLNYRLGALGFLSLETAESPGNMGLTDQTLALEWVNNNIGHFGGDSSRITLFGQSAGSFSVAYHLVSPRAAGLFSAAVAQSGAPFSTYDGLLQVGGCARRVATGLARCLGCSVASDGAVLSCLRNTSVGALLNLTMFTPLCLDPTEYICSTSPWLPMVDGGYAASPVLPKHPVRLVEDGEYNKVPLVVGVNSADGSYSAAKYIGNNSKFDEINRDWDFHGPLNIFDKTENVTEDEKVIANRVKDFYLGRRNASMETIHEVVDMFSDIVFWAGAHHLVRLAAARQAEPVYQYMLTYKGSMGCYRIPRGLDLGACHSDDLLYLFKLHNQHQSKKKFDEDDLVIRKKFLTWWTNFAKTRTPDDEEVWGRVQLDDHKYLDINLEPSMEYSQRYRERMDFWMEILETRKSNGLTSA